MLKWHHQYSWRAPSIGMETIKDVVWTLILSYAQNQCLACRLYVIFNISFIGHLLDCQAVYSVKRSRVLKIIKWGDACRHKNLKTKKVSYRVSCIKVSVFVHQ